MGIVKLIQRFVLRARDMAVSTSINGSFSSEPRQWEAGGFMRQSAKAMPVPVRNTMYQIDKRIEIVRKKENV